MIIIEQLLRSEFSNKDERRQTNNSFISITHVYRVAKNMDVVILWFDIIQLKKKIRSAGDN